MKQLLLIDDEKRMLDLLALYLTPHHYECIKLPSGIAGIRYLEENEVDLVLLDIMMPAMDGWATLKRIREFSEVPIIMLTARNDQDDIIKGLKNGADDYISKPFNEKELLARIEAVLRRTSKDSILEKPLSFNNLTLHRSSFHVEYKGEKIPVTPKEFAILELFLLNPDKVFSRDHLITSLWELNTETENRTIDSHIRNLRDKLRKAEFFVDKHLQTIWGVGYRWNNKFE